MPSHWFIGNSTLEEYNMDFGDLYEYGYKGTREADRLAMVADLKKKVTVCRAKRAAARAAKRIGNSLSAQALRYKDQKLSKFMIKDRNGEDRLDESMAILFRLGLCDGRDFVQARIQLSTSLYFLEDNKDDRASYDVAIAAVDAIYKIWNHPILNLPED